MTDHKRQFHAAGELSVLIPGRRDEELVRDFIGHVAFARAAGSEVQGSDSRIFVDVDQGQQPLFEAALQTWSAEARIENREARL